MQIRQNTEMDFKELDAALPRVLRSLVFEYIPEEIFLLVKKGKIITVAHLIDLLKYNFQLAWECITKKLYNLDVYGKIFMWVCRSEYCNIQHMKWLLDNKFPYDVCVFSQAAANDNLDNMKWLLENKFPYDGDVFMSAADNGNLDNMKWLAENKFPYGPEVFVCAAANGDLDNMKWLLENKFPCNEDTFSAAVELGHINVSKWLIEKNFPYNKEELLKKAQKNEKILDIVKKLN